MDDNQLNNGSINAQQQQQQHMQNEKESTIHSSPIATHNGNHDNSNHVNGNQTLMYDDNGLDNVCHWTKSRFQIPRSLSLTNASCSRREPVEHRRPSLVNSRSRSCVSTPDGYKTWSFQDVAYDEDSFVHINEWFDRYDTNACSKTEVIYLHPYR